MKEIAKEIIGKYGVVRVVLGFDIAGIVVWSIAHISSAPNSEVSVLWDLVKYTKKPEPAPITPHSTSRPVYKSPRREDSPSRLPALSTTLKEKSQSTEEISSKTDTNDHLSDFDALIPKRDLRLSGATRTQPEKNSFLSVKIIHNFENDDIPGLRISLRKEHTLRELSGTESGRRVSELPAGTYFYMLPGHINASFTEMPSKRFSSGLRDFEVHYTDKETFFLLGFISEGEASRIAELTGKTAHRVTVAVWPTNALTSLVAIPLHRTSRPKTRTLELSPNEEVSALDLTVK